MQLPESFYQQPPTYPRQQGALFTLAGRHPGLCRLSSLGRSVLGREIYALSLGRAEGVSLYVGGVHGQEWITVLLLLRFLDELLTSIAQSEPIAEIQVKKALSRRGLTLVPCLNPDGVEIALRETEGAGCLGEAARRLCKGRFSRWQANARGVDLNHNFDAGWNLLRRMEEEQGISGPGPTRYGGPFPESEPETQAVCSFCRKAPVQRLYAFHSQGEEIYFRYGPGTPRQSRLMAQLLASSSGYRPRDPEGLAGHGGLKDWFIQEFSRPGFTIEVGKGENPLPIGELPGMYSRLRELLALGLIL